MKSLTLLPVIHVLDRDTTMANARLAIEAGCHGVFLISMSGDDWPVPTYAAEVKAAFPDSFVGINLLTKPASVAVDIAIRNGLDGTWGDDPIVTSTGHDEDAQRIVELLKGRPEHTYFASVAFKGQEEERDPARALRRAEDLGFLPTTSGPGTGRAAQLGKIHEMSAAATMGRLGLASGVTPQNLQQFGPWISHVLVATGISRDEHHFDPCLVRQLVENARKVSPPPPLGISTSP